MDFHQLLAKMQEIDTPVPEQTTNEMGCGDNPMSPMPSMPQKPDTPPPTMSINLNAQGMDNIEDLMKLVTKVNPDMDKPSMPPLPSLGAEPSIMSIKPEAPPMSGIGDLGNLDAGPLKMLPDLDKEEPRMEPDGDDEVSKAHGDLDNDGDHDMDDHDMEKKKDKEEGFANGMEDDAEPEYKDTDYMMNKLSGGLGRQQTMYKHSYKQGDNPMAMENTDLRAQIRAELQRRLAEAKGVK